MLLNKGEAILCNNQEETIQMAQVLEGAGYKMFHNQWSSIVDVVKDCDSSFRCGFRWLPGHTFPMCVATVSKDLKEELLETGKITCDEDVSEFSWRWAEDFLGKTHVNVEDLL